MAAPNSGEHTPAHARRSNELVAAQHWYRGISAALATAPEDSPTAVACRALLPDVMYRIDKLLGDADEEG